MTTLTVSVADRITVKMRALAAFDGKPQGSYVSFAKPELAWRVITPDRLAILEAMVGAGAMSLRLIAHRVAREIEAVDSDVQALLDAGVLRRDENGIILPFDAIHFDFMLVPAA